jgi:hypothetical protein
MPTVFISYRREDSAGYAGRLHEELEERLGPGEVFRDVDTLRAGQDFDDTIHQRLAQCAACIVMIGPQWLKAQTATGQRRLDQPGDYVVMEIAAALARPDVRVVPVLVGGVPMPTADDLPAAIRPLARRHAFSARDETWDADMDRLLEALGIAVSEGHPVSSISLSGNRRKFALLSSVGIAGLLMILALVWFVRTGTRTSPTSADAATIAREDGAVSGEPPSSSNAVAIDVPSRGAEILQGDVIYTPIAGSIQPRGTTTRVWLRFRVANEGRYGANLWDSSFRLVVGGSVVAANGGLNEILDGQSVRQAVVRFDVPSAPHKATLRISSGDRSGEVPLDLSGNGRPAQHEQQDASDALSRATLTTVLDSPQMLVRGGEASASVLRITSRRFANAQRLRLDIQWNSEGRYPVGTFDLVLRLIANGETLAPVSAPSQAIAGGATYRDTVVFDVGPDVRQVVLKASLRGAEREVPLTLH